MLILRKNNENSTLTGASIEKNSEGWKISLPGKESFFFKDADKCLCIFIAETQRNVVDGVCCIYEKALALSHAQRTFPFTESHAGCIFDQLRTIREGKTKVAGNIRKRYGINVLLDIIQHKKIIQSASMT